MLWPRSGQEAWAALPLRNEPRRTPRSDGRDDDGGTQGIRTLTPPVKSRVFYLLSKRPASVMSPSFMMPPVPSMRLGVHISRFADDVAG